MRTQRICMLLSSVCVAAGLAVAQEKKPAPASRPAAPTAQKPAADENAPRLQVEPPEWNFGQVWYGETPRGVLTLKNVGRATLEITRVKTSCGCTAAKLTKTSLAPGESVPLKVSYKKKRTGRVSQTVRVMSNDPRRPTTVIRVKGEIKPLFEGLDQIYFGQLTPNDREVKTVELKNAWDEKVYLKLKNAAPNAKYYDIRLEELEPGMRYRLTVATKPPLKQGALITNVNFETNLTRIPKLTMPVRASVYPRVAVRPETLWVSPNVPQARERPVRVTYMADQPIEIAEIKPSQEGLKVRLMPPGATRPSTRFASRTILVTPPPPEEIPQEGIKLEIFTSDPEFPKLEVLVKRVRVRGPREAGPGAGRRIAERARRAQAAEAANQKGGKPATTRPAKTGDAPGGESKHP